MSLPIQPPAQAPDLLALLVALRRALAVRQLVHLLHVRRVLGGHFRLVCSLDDAQQGFQLRPLALPPLPHQSLMSDGVVGLMKA
jgi:hypothetical protein